jgi:PTS system galactitol-specific IIC component
VDTVIKLLNDFLNLGPSVVIPVFLLILGALMRMKFGRAVRGAVTYGIGFIGILVILDLLLGSLGAAAEALVGRTGLTLEIVDVGWPVLAAVAFGVPTFATIFLGALVANLVLFAIGLIKTLDIDFFNYYHFTLAGTFVFFLTGNLWLATIVGLVIAILTLKVSDLSAPYVEEWWELPQVSVPTMTAVGLYPFAKLTNWVIDRIPGLNRIRLDPGRLQKRLGVLGEPMMLGLIVATLIALGAGYNISQLLDFAIKMAASLVLLPRMIGLLMEGLTPFAQVFSKWVQERFPGREILIGLDAAVLVGKPEVLVTALLAVPVTIVLALILPGNRVLPFADLATIPFYATFAVGVNKGNIFRGLLIVTLVMAIALYGAGWVAPTLTQMGEVSGFQTDASQVYTALDAGVNITSLLGIAPIIITLVDVVPDWTLAILSILLGVAFWFLFQWVASLKTRDMDLQEQLKPAAPEPAK